MRLCVQGVRTGSYALGNYELKQCRMYQNNKNFRALCLLELLTYYSVLFTTRHFAGFNRMFTVQLY